MTVIFCDLVGSTELGERFDAEPLGRMMSMYYARMREALERHGGTVEKFIGDAVVAVFGVPRTHHDDALRAVRAASEMLESIRALNKEQLQKLEVELEVRIGVQTGEVIAEAGDGLIFGDAMNVAARLEQSAPVNGILIGASTYELTSSAVIARPVDPVKAKGKADPVPAFKLVETLKDLRNSSLGPSSPLVGRGEELRALNSALERHRGGSPTVVLLTGAPGVGKSRLVREFLQRSDLRAISRRCMPPGEAQSTDRAFQPGSEWAGAEVIALDHLHWAEEPELETIVDFFGVEGGATQFGILISRPEISGQKRLDELRPRTIHLVLDPLSQADTEELVRTAAAFTDPDLIDRVALAAEGNPLHARELARFVSLAGGKLSVEEVPPTIRALLAARIDELPDHERFVLECAAVIGQGFKESELTDLARACGAPHPECHVEALIARQLIRPSSALGLVFDSTVIREVVYQGTLRQTRARLHEAFARLLREGGDTSESSPSELIAQHLIAAAESVPERGFSRARREKLAQQAAAYISRSSSSEKRSSATDELVGRLRDLLAERDPKEGRETFKRDSAARLELIDEAGRVQVVEVRSKDSPVTIGRGSGNDVLIAWDPELSRSHAELSWSGEGWQLHDLGSRNGSVVNGTPATGRQVLEDGDRITLGLTHLRFRER